MDSASSMVQLFGVIDVNAAHLTKSLHSYTCLACDGFLSRLLPEWPVRTALCLLKHDWYFKPYRSTSAAHILQICWHGALRPDLILGYTLWTAMNRSSLISGTNPCSWDRMCSTIYKCLVKQTTHFSSKKSDKFTLPYSAMVKYAGYQDSWAWSLPWQCFCQSTHIPWWTGWGC